MEWWMGFTVGLTVGITLGAFGIVAWAMMPPRQKPLKRASR